MNILLCGCGAIGSWMGLFLASSRDSLRLIDDDTVGEENISTSAYNRRSIGSPKASSLSRMMYEKSGAKSWPHTHTLDSSYLSSILADVNTDLVIDTFDNIASRSLLCSLPIPTVHVGVSGPHQGAIVWDNTYTLPDGLPRGEDTFCTHMAGKSILRHVASQACVIVDHWVRTGEQKSLVVGLFGTVEWRD
uniref:Putative ubiquitin activating domain contining protein n=1 Tax=viral metagenome TaxID=1070528 RepID=A0A6M3LDI8_9ZZZZ